MIWGRGLTSFIRLGGKSLTAPPVNIADELENKLSEYLGMWNGTVYLMGHTPTTLCSHCLLWNQKVQLAQGFVPVDMSITFSNLRQKLACLSQNISYLLFRWDLYFLERFMYTGVHQCIFIRRSVTDIHLELCPLGYYCIKIKYWTMDFLLKKNNKKVQRQENKWNKSGDFSNYVSSVFSWYLLFLFEKMQFSMECTEKMP